MLAKSDGDLKLMHGDELRLRYLGELYKPWSGIGHLIKIPDNYGEEVGIELKTTVELLLSALVILLLISYGKVQVLLGKITLTKMKLVF